MNFDILQIMKLRDKTHQKAVSLHSSTIMADYRQLRNRVNALICRSRKEYYQEAIDKAKGNSKAVRTVLKAGSKSSKGYCIKNSGRGHKSTFH